MTETQKRLEAAGFTVSKVYPGAKWFEVTDPTGEAGAVLCQSFAAWHYFSRDVAATASSSDPKRCHLDGLGDAIGTDAQMATYKGLLHPNRVPRPLQRFEGVYAAMGQVAAD